MKKQEFSKSKTNNKCMICHRGGEGYPLLSLEPDGPALVCPICKFLLMTDSRRSWLPAYVWPEEEPEENPFETLKGCEVENPGKDSSDNIAISLSTPFCTVSIRIGAVAD